MSIEAKVVFWLGVAVICTAVGTYSLLVGLSRMYDEARAYTKVCNERGGVALNAYDERLRQCVKDMGTTIIIQLKKEQ